MNQYRENAGGFDVEGYEWATEAVEEWLRQDKVVMDAAWDVLFQYEDSDRRQFWLAKLLYDVVGGNGLPWMRRVPKNVPDRANILHVDWERVAQTILREYPDKTN